MENKEQKAKKWKPLFPIVFKNSKCGILTIVYKNRVENYDLKNKESKKDIDESNGENCCYDYEDIYGKGWNAHHEIDMLKNNGFKRVRDTESEHMKED